MAKWTVGEPKELNEVLPAGEYNARVVKAETSIQQAGKTAGSDKITLTWNVDGRSLVQDSLIFHESMGWKLNQFVAATGIGKVGDCIEIDDKTVLDRECVVVVSQKELESTKKPGEKFKVNNITHYKAAAF